MLVTAEGHSIYVRNLPFNATTVQLAEVFKKFGPIKRDGIQVRSNKVCFVDEFCAFFLRIVVIIIYGYFSWHAARILFRLC